MQQFGLRHSRSFPLVFALAGLSIGAFGCGGSGLSSAPANQGPNSSVSNPGPNPTNENSGPNPTDPSLKTLSGKLAFIGSCAQLTLDSSTVTYSLHFSKDYSILGDGIHSNGVVIAPPKARLFVTGTERATAGACGKDFSVDSLNSVQNP